MRGKWFSEGADHRRAEGDGGGGAPGSGAVEEARDRARGLVPVEGEVRGLDLSQAKRLRALEEENRRLKRPVADHALDIQTLKDVASEDGDAHGEAGRGTTDGDGAWG